MEAYLRQALHWENLPFLVLLALMLIYWIVVAAGLLRVQALDVWVGTDYLKQSGEPPKGFHLKLLRAGQVPLAVGLTLLLLIVAIISIAYTTQLVNYGAWLPIALVVPNLIAGLLLVYLIPPPFARPAAASTTDPQQLEGQPATVTVAADQLSSGKARLHAGEQSVAIRALSADQPLDKDAHIVLMKYDRSGGFFYASVVKGE